MTTCRYHAKTLRLGLMLLVPILASAGSCTGIGKAALERFANATDDQTARAFLADVQAARYDSANMLLALSAHDSVSAETWEGMRKVLDGADLDSAYLVGVFTNVSNGVRSSALSYEGPVDGRWFVAGVRLYNGSVTDARMNREERTVGDTNAFRLSDMTLVRFLVFAAGFSVMMLSLIAFGLVLRSKMPRRGRWAVASLFGVGSLGLNWTTSGIFLKLLTVRIPVFTFVKTGPYAPWTFQVLFPLGAILALRRWRKYRDATADEAA